ncbi:flagellar export protein FliJ [Thiobacillus denitrificans]|jgi:flagellar FliJ protein|uniref:flagellar export protein FliJ n=1 Tax=Thiobacillus denitrificans TaxID=36861 RepID=UPI00037E24B6|nr:flagellar export protein FliJ [Thiobacillus denitrificans]
MATPSALNTLIDLAHKETDAAAKQLGAALRAGEEAEQKLDLLTQYRDDYAARCQSDLSAGISTTHFNNFQIFMQKLDHAIAGQQKVVGEARQRVDQARTVWQSCEQKKMSFVTLADRASKEDLRRELWRDQKQNDEHAARRTLHKRTPS